MHRAVGALLLTFFVACANPEVTPPDASVFDAGPRDAGSGTVDAGERDAGERDGGGRNDAGTSEDAGSRDTGPRDAGDLESCDLTVVARFDGVSWGTLRGPATFDPTGPAPIMIERRMEPDAQESLLIARHDASGVAWTAQVTSDSSSSNLRHDAVEIDASDGSIIVAVTYQPAQSTFVRVYDAAGAVTTLTRGTSIPGGGAQQIGLLMKFDVDGALAWVVRFGPNDPSGTVQHVVRSIAVASDRITVAATMAPGTLILGPGEADQRIEPLTRATGYWVSFAKGDGHYLPASLRLVRSADADVQLTGRGLHDAASFGNLSVAGIVGGAATTEIGAGASVPISVMTSGASTFLTGVRFGGDPEWAVTIAPQTGSPLEIDALASDTLGVTVAGGRAVAPGTHVSEFGPANLQVTFTLGEGFLVQYSVGALSWLRRIAGTASVPVQHAVYASVSRDVVVVGSGAADTILAAGDADAFAFREPVGPYVARFDSSTGGLRWARVLGGGLDVFDAWPNAAHETRVAVTVPSRVTVWGGDLEVVLDPPDDVRVRAIVEFERDGALIGCASLSRGYFPRVKML